MNKASGNMETVYQTEAQWTADDRVFSADVVAVTTDGANAGKHKLFKGTGRWSTLSYVEDGGANVYLNGTAQSGIYTKVASSVNGVVTIDWTAETPALSSAKVLSVFVEASPQLSARVDGPSVGNMVIQLFDQSTQQDSTDTGQKTTVTVVGIEA